MFSLLQRSLSGATLFQLGAEGLWLFFAVILALKFHGQLAAPVLTAGAPAFVFAVLIVSLNGAFGLYRRDAKIPFGAHVTRMFLALLIGVPIAYLVARILPGGDRFNDTLGEAVLFAYAGLVVVRYLIVPPIVRTLLPRRVLVLGTGPRGTRRRSLARDGRPTGRRAGRFLRAGKDRADHGVAEPRDRAHRPP